MGLSKQNLIICVRYIVHMTIYFHNLRKARQPTSEWLFIIVYCHIFANKCFTIKWTKTCKKHVLLLLWSLFEYCTPNDKFFFQHFTNGAQLSYLHMPHIVSLFFGRQFCMWFVGATKACGIGFVVVAFFLFCRFSFVFCLKVNECIRTNEFTLCE